MSRSTDPPELAARLGIDPKRLRDWLRLTYPRGQHEKNQPWVIDAELERCAIQPFSRG